MPSRDKALDRPQRVARRDQNTLRFMRELARRLHGTQVTANCLHPGFVATRFADESGGLISRTCYFTGLSQRLPGL